jgi:hypothetical protein
MLLLLVLRVTPWGQVFQEVKCIEPSINKREEQEEVVRAGLHMAQRFACHCHAQRAKPPPLTTIFFRQDETYEQ